jgi:molecular chaperone Hsp33
LGELFAEQQTPEQVVQEKFSALNPQFLGNQRVEFFCRCSKDRMQNYLRSLPQDEKTDIIKNGPFPLETRCHHCNSAYHFNRDEIKALEN